MASHAVVTRLILNLPPPGPTRTRQVTRASGWRSRWRFGRPEVGCIVRAARPRAAREPRHALRRHRHRTRGPRGDDRRLRADVRARVGQSVDHPRAHGASRDRLGLPAHVPAQRGGGQPSAPRGLLGHRDALAAAARRARGVPHGHGLRAAGQTPVVDQSGLQPRSDDAVGGRRPHDLPARSTTAHRARSRSGPCSQRSPQRSRCLRSAKHS